MIGSVMAKDKETTPIKLRLISVLPAVKYNVINNVGEDIKITISGKDINLEKG